MTADTVIPIDLLNEELNEYKLVKDEKNGHCN